MKKKQYVVWSFDADEQQTFVDIKKATSPEHAERLVRRSRPYATLDSYVKPVLLVDYIAYLTKAVRL